jgi:hypothetical protein
VENTRFNDIAKALGSPTSRRLTLSALLGGTLARLGLADVEAAKSGRCKPKCDACERCNKGKCRRTKSGKKRCKKGKCVLQPGAPTCGPDQVRNEETCGCCKPPGGSCAPTGETVDCCSGFCGFPGVCAGRPSGRSCTFGAQCQSGACNNGFCT